MADLTLSRSWTPTTPAVARPVWLDQLSHRAEVLRRRGRRNRYLAITGRSTSGYPWFEAMFQSMSGR
jgi:hypothetical protein